MSQVQVPPEQLFFSKELRLLRSVALVFLKLKKSHAHLALAKVCPVHWVNDRTHYLKRKVTVHRAKYRIVTKIRNLTREHVI